MAVLHKKEEKIQAVLGRLPKKYTNEEFVAMFIKLYSKDWGKIKSAYIKQSQDKEPGTVINMPKPDLYLKQLLETYLKNNAALVEVKEEPVVVAKAPKKAAVKKKEVIEEPIADPETIPTAKKVKTPAKKKIIEDEAVVKTKKPVAVKKAKEEKK